MAFNFQTFKTRALTAIVFVLVMLAGLLWNQWSFLVLFSIIHFGCWTEYQKLVGLIDPAYQKITVYHRYGIMLVGWGFVLWMCPASFRVNDVSISRLGWYVFSWSGIAFAMSFLFFLKNNQFKLLAHSFMGCLYISLSWGLMMKLYGNLNHTVFTGADWIMPVVLIAAIWINDTMAYIVGSFIGKTPFSSISPKKTWEGTIGGALLAVLAVTLIGHYAFNFPIRALVLMSLVAAIAGTAGDLFESKLKRLAGVKDSGSIMPGHGGFLDRFDSLLVATTVTWALFRLFY